MEHVATSYKGRVNERYSTEVVAAVLSKFFQNVAKSMSLVCCLDGVEVGSEMSMIGSTFHKRGTLKEMMHC